MASKAKKKKSISGSASKSAARSMEKKTAKKRAPPKKKAVEMKAPTGGVRRNDTLLRAGYSGIIYLLLSLLIIFMSMMLVETRSQIVNYLLVMVVATTFSVVYMLGYARFGKLAKNNILMKASYLFVALMIIDLAYMLIMTAMGLPAHPYVAAIVMFFNGGIGVMFGKGIWDLRETFGRLAQTTGMLNIFAGILMLIFILNPAVGGFGVLLALFTEILNIAIIFKASKVYA
ncbi:MAG: hypothetical protein KJ574_01870 [Nanoarchaeota archaeon]|nr:hypothetical protein [Nanoarchaeota archaeon]